MSYPQACVKQQTQTLRASRGYHQGENGLGKYVGTWKPIKVIHKLSRKLEKGAAK